MPLVHDVVDMEVLFQKLSWTIAPSQALSGRKSNSECPLSTVRFGDSVVCGKLGRRLRNADLSCRRVWWNFKPRKPQKSKRRLFQILLWLKLAVFFALFVDAAGANNSPKSYDVRTAWILAHAMLAWMPCDLRMQGLCRRFSRVRSKRTGL